MELVAELTCPLNRMVTNRRCKMGADPQQFIMVDPYILVESGRAYER